MKKKVKTWDLMTEEEREEYVNQDVVDREEILISNPIDYSASYPSFVPNDEVIIRMYFKENKKVMDIARTLKVRHQYVSQIVSKYKSIISETICKYEELHASTKLQIDVIKYFFLEQKTEEETAKLLGISQPYVSTIINKFKKFL